MMGKLTNSNGRLIMNITVQWCSGVANHYAKRGGLSIHSLIYHLYISNQH